MSKETRSSPSPSMGGRPGVPGASTYGACARGEAAPDRDREPPILAVLRQRRLVEMTLYRRAIRAHDLRRAAVFAVRIRLTDAEIEEWQRTQTPAVPNAPCAGVRLLHIALADGTEALCAVSRSRPGYGYQLVPDGEGRLTCSCTGFAYRGRCGHTDAAEINAQRALTERTREP